MDPGDATVRQRALDVIGDVVRRYDIDGVHLDDYFYPYPENNRDFPDEPSWQTYRGPLTRSEWRRENINHFVRDLYSTVKLIRPDVEVGISPFGIWRPRNPRQIRGLDAYEKIYADSRLWLQEGWVDYLAPQLYWPIEKREQSFPALLHWWSRQDRRGRGIVAGISINRPATRAEIARQLELVRDERQSVGFILFSAHTVMQNPDGIDDILAHELQR
jgi:uncharacterized lipoprotein YddW (UPF0748 family)